MQTHAERFRHLMLEWNLTQEEMGNLCGLKRGTIGTIVNGKTQPDVEALAALYKARPQLSLNWLLLGTGPMLRDGRALSQLPPMVPSALPTTPASPLRIDTSGEDSDYWKTIATDRLRENEFLKELLRAANGLNRPADAEEPQAPGGVGKCGGSEFAAAYAAPAERLVVGGLRRYEAVLFVDPTGHRLAWVDAVLSESLPTPRRMEVSA